MQFLVSNALEEKQNYSASMIIWDTFIPIMSLINFPTVFKQPNLKFLSRNTWLKTGLIVILRFIHVL